MGDLSRYGFMRRFFLDRERDETGISGTGTVAQGVVFFDGTVAIRWMTDTRSSAFYDSVEAVEKIHGHNGATKIRWADAICFACGGCLDWHEHAARHCFGCGAGQGDALFFETNPNPSLGSWTPALVIGKQGDASPP